MKNIGKSFVLIITIVSFLSACQSKKDHTSENKINEKKDSAKTEMPAKLNLTEDEIILRDQEKAQAKVMKVKAKMAVEAQEAILNTQKAIKLISKNDPDQAVKQLLKALDKIDAVTNKFPDFELVPIDINVKRNVLITDINSVRQISRDAQNALKNEHLQEARKLLTGLSSEIDISTVNLPLLTYPTAIKSAIKLINEKKLIEAKSILIDAFDQFVIVNDMIPVPVLDAEVMIDEAARLNLEDREANKEEVINLLENANYELNLAEVLGYGNKDKTYKKLKNDIKAIKKAANEGSELKELFKKLKVAVKNFKERVF